MIKKYKSTSGLIAVENRGVLKERPKLMRQIKVLHVINSLKAGGAEVLLKNLILQGKKGSTEDRNFHFEVAILYPELLYKEEIEKIGIPVWDLDLNFKYNVMGLIKLIFLIKQGKYDIVHVHLFPSSLFVSMASLFLPKTIQFIFSEHNIYNRRRSYKMLKYLDALIYSRYHKIICVSKQVQVALVQWIPTLKRKTTVIPNAVPVPDLSQWSTVKKYDILFVGRLTKAKGLDILLRAIKILKEENQKPIQAAIVGTGHLEQELKELVIELGIGKEVKFLGTRKDIESLMRTSKIFVLPSRWEGLPLTILEAMTSGAGIIATQVGGILEVIENRKEGILIPPEDEVTLSKAIAELLKDEPLRMEFAKKAYLKVKESYSIEVYTKKILEFYQSFMNQ